MSTSMHTRIKQAQTITKKCYFIGCNNSPIKAHSIPNKGFLKKISDNGHVMYFDLKSDHSMDITLVETGRAQASTFKGFCDEHDKAFTPIDSGNYHYTERENFLFAMRAAAKEYNTKIAANHVVEKDLAGNDLDPFWRTVFEGMLNGAKDLEHQRATFCNLYGNRVFHAVQTAIIEVSQPLPVAVSSSFFLDKNLEGEVINELGNPDIKVRPCFFTLFPQENKTIGLVSWFKRDRKSYRFFENLTYADESYKETLLSNILMAYTENMAVKPGYWQNVMTYSQRHAYTQGFMETLPPCPPRSLIHNPEFSLFPSK